MEAKLSKLITSTGLWVGILTAGYFLTHLWNLTGLPVFADEAIYIRWSQLIVDDWWRYLFFPLNDGKTPLFIWLLVPGQLTALDPLWVSRLISVLVGWLQLGVIAWLTLLLGGSKKTAVLSAVLTMGLPFWFFHHRMALMDGTLTLFLSLAVVGAVKLAYVVSDSVVRPKVLAFSMLLISVGLASALWTKVSAILIVPSLLMMGWLMPRITKQYVFRFAVLLTGAVTVGVVGFGLLKLSPAFGQLFSRGGDFLYPLSFVVLTGGWRQTLVNIPTYLSYLWTYLSPLIFLLIPVQMFSPHKKRIYLILWLAAVAFAGPIAIFGRVVYPRYFLPVAVFLTPVLALSIAELTRTLVSAREKILIKLFGAVAVMTVFGILVNHAALFMVPALLDPDKTSFVAADRVQYLTEWSSGHGIANSVQLIQATAESSSLAVATEGYFGTLPDGILMYLHQQDVSNLYIEGVGQPVLAIPESFISRAKSFDQVWLVVNSHRLGLKLTPNLLIAEYCRPYFAPCLQVWNITDLIEVDP